MECVRVSATSAESPIVKRNFLATSREVFIAGGFVGFLGVSSETPYIWRSFLATSAEVTQTPAEYEVQNPETGEEYTPPSPEDDYVEDEWPEPSDPQDPIAPPLSPGGWPLRHKDGSVATRAYWMDPTEVRCSLGGLDLVPYLLSVSVQETRGGPCGGSLTCRDRDGLLAAALDEFEMDSDRTRPHDRTFNRTIRLRITQAGVSSSYPEFVPGDSSWDEDGVVTIPFSDGNEILDLDNQSLPNIVADEGKGGKANATLRALGDLAGVSVVPMTPDYKIKTFRFNEQNVISGMDQICQVVQGYRVFEGRTCRIKNLQESPSRWKFKDRLHIESLTGGYDTSSLKTFFRAFRTEAQPTYIAAPISCIGGECVGRVVNMTFEFPTMYAIMYYTSPNGEILDGVFFDADDIPLNQTPSNIFYGNHQRKAVRWEATFKPKFSRNDAYVPQWTCWGFGGPPPSGQNRDAYVAELAAASTEAFFGRRPETTDLSSELILDESTLDLMLQRVVKEAQWAAKRFTLQSPYLAPARVGDFVHVEDELLDVNESLLIKGWNHNWSASDGFSATYDLAGKI